MNNQGIKLQYRICIQVYRSLLVYLILLVVPVMLIGFAIAGVRLGRNTYLVDIAPARERPLYVALSNTIAGVFILLGGGLGVVTDVLGIQVLFIVLIALAFVGAASSWSLAEAEQMTA